MTKPLPAGEAAPAADDSPFAAPDDAQASFQVRKSSRPLAHAHNPRHMLITLGTSHMLSAS